jgi:hypothetical protein
VTDTRGRSTSKTKTINCYDYKPPAISEFSVMRSDTGTNAICTCKVTFSDLDKKNKAVLHIYCNGNKITPSAGKVLQSTTRVTITSSSILKLNQTYSLYAEVTDYVHPDTTIKTDTVQCYGTSKIFNIHPNGNGFAFGETASPNSFSCVWPATFRSTVTSNVGAGTSSDRRVKENIQDVSINIVDKLRPVQYQLTQFDDGKIHYGFVAQEIVEVLTDAEVNPEQTGIIGHTTQDGQEIYTLTYTEFIPLVVKKCQELQKENNEMRAEIAEIKTMLLAHNSE